MDFSRDAVYEDIKKQDPESLKDFTFKEFCHAAYFHPVGSAKRLKNHGYMFLRKYYPCHEVEVPITEKRKNIPAKHYLFLARFCRKPYYIGKKKIIFFDEEEGFLFKLCDGDIDNVKTVSPEMLDE